MKQNTAIKSVEILKKAEVVKNKKMKKGFTLIEIVLVAVIIATLAGLIIPKILANARATDYLSTAQEDFKSLKTAVIKYRFDNNNITSATNTDDIINYMPDTFQILSEQDAAGTQLMKDKDDNLFKFAFLGNQDGTADVTIKLNNFDKIPFNLRQKIIIKGVKMLNCDKTFSVEDDSAKELDLKSCTF